MPPCCLERSCLFRKAFQWRVLSLVCYKLDRSQTRGRAGLFITQVFSSDGDEGICFLSTVVVSADIIQNSANGNFSPKTEGTKTKAAGCLFFWCLFPSCTFWILCNLLLLFTFCQVCLLVKETAEIETGMAEKSSWDQANIQKKPGLVWRNRNKISQIIKDYFYLPFFLLIILCTVARIGKHNFICCTESRKTKR